MKRVLVTGGTGFIGRHALTLLADSGYEVHAVIPSADESVPDDRAQTLVADLLEPEAPAKAVAAVEPTHLLHMAWYVEPGQVWASLLNVRWVEASLALLRAFGESGGSRAVFAGTCSEYGHPADGICSEQTPLAPTNLYGASKSALGALALATCVKLGVSAVWPRIFFAYGPYEHPRRLVSSVARNLLLGHEAPCSHGRQVRDYLFTPDISAALVHLLESEFEGSVNVGSGEGVSLRELVSRLATIIGRPELVEFGAIEAGPNEPPVLVADVGRLRDGLGWTPAHDLAAGLEQTVDWWRGELIRTGELAT